MCLVFRAGGGRGEKIFPLFWGAFLPLVRSFLSRASFLPCVPASPGFPALQHSRPYLNERGQASVFVKCSEIPVWNAYRRLHIFGKMLILEEQFSRLRGAGFAKLQKRFSKIAALEGARFPKLHLNFP